MADVGAESMVGATTARWFATWNSASVCRPSATSITTVLAHRSGSVRL